MSAPALVCAGIEIALNRYLQLEPAALAACVRLAGRSLAVRPEPLAASFVIEFHSGGVRVLPEVGEPADATLTASPVAFLAALRNLAAEDQSLPRGMQVKGDAMLLQAFRRMLRSVGLNPEELLAPIVGDVAAYRLHRGARSLLRWTTRSGAAFGDNFVEYLREESRDLARAPDVADWMDAVDEARERADRIEARLRRLERRLSEWRA